MALSALYTDEDISTLVTALSASAIKNQLLYA
jgi:hypothetical protein